MPGGCDGQWNGSFTRKGTPEPGPREAGWAVLQAVAVQDAFSLSNVKQRLTVLSEAQIIELLLPPHMQGGDKDTRLCF